MKTPTAVLQPLAQIRNLLRDISTRNLAARQSLTGIGPKRAEIIVAGVAVLQEVMEQFKIPRLFYSSAGLREGIISDMAYRNVGHEHARMEPDQRRLVQSLGLRYGLSGPHVRSVALLASMLFAGLQPLHQLPPATGRLLEAAAYLYNIGHFVNEAAIIGIPSTWLRIPIWPAFLTGADRNRQSVPVSPQVRAPGGPRRASKMLDLESRRIVVLLTPLLRLAVALDQSQEQRVERVETFYPRTLRGGGDCIPRAILTLNSGMPCRWAMSSARYTAANWRFALPNEGARRQTQIGKAFRPGLQILSHLGQRSAGCRCHSWFAHVQPQASPGPGPISVRRPADATQREEGDYGLRAGPRPGRPDRVAGRRAHGRSQLIRKKLDTVRREAQRKLARRLRRWRDRDILSSWKKALLRGTGAPDIRQSVRYLMEDFFDRGDRAVQSGRAYKRIHRFRSIAKKLRYTLELTEPRDSAKLQALKGLQDRLGALNDCVVAIELVTDISSGSSVVARNMRRLLPRKEKAFRVYWKDTFPKPGRTRWLKEYR